MDKARLKRYILVAQGKEPADLVLKNGYIANTISGEFYKADVAICDDIIVGVASDYHGLKEIELSNACVLPGFIDSHMHLESSMVTLSEFSKAVLPRGTTTVIIDPHEISNVLGEKGIEYLLEEAEKVPLNVYIMLPSCVPATPFDISGAILKAENLKKFSGNKRVLGLGELMNYPGVLNLDEDIIDKILLFYDKKIDGHAPNLSNKDLCAYIVAGIKSDHECITPTEALEKLRLGMNIMLREGSSTKNLRDLLPVVNRFNSRGCFFATDDRDPIDLLEVGHIDNMIKIAIKEQGNVMRAIRLATINPATYFGLTALGAIAPSYKADIVVVDDFLNFKVRYVVKDGKILAKDGKPLFNIKVTGPSFVKNTIRVKEFVKESFSVKTDFSKSEVFVRVIGVVPEQIITKKLKIKLKVVNGEIQPDIEKDILLIASIERHHKTGKIGVGFIQGFGVIHGAIAMSIGHDSHNIVAVGVSSEMIYKAVTKIVEMQGGIVVCNATQLEALPLPIAGLMSDKPIQEVARDLKNIERFIRALGCPLKSPLITLSFMCLPVIPELKLTVNGLFDSVDFKKVELIC